MRWIAFLVCAVVCLSCSAQSAPTAQHSSFWKEGIVLGSIAAGTYVTERYDHEIDRNMRYTGDSHWIDTSANIGAEYIPAALSAAELFGGILTNNAEMKDRGLQIGVALAVDYGTEQGIKRVAGRCAPLAGAHGAFRTCYASNKDSFPSGHSMAGFSTAKVLATQFPRWKYPLYFGAGTIGVLRVVSSAHWPSDVVAGAGLGYSIGLVTTHAISLQAKPMRRGMMLQMTMRTK